ncbi:ubiquitin family protein [Actinokineospora iranica]|uniref:Excalibur calcium-binding domain-containing protein n=1 Tax=Actinokineospora iranica TaxID=1271860 RepID=A0A1G6J388_9PSEU|nr:hypothetical protein [Actinokineospora iranica]SDC13150.1 hypothetical protein SAMN05216174_101214 [Actinokineospora iranica]
MVENSSAGLVMLAAEVTVAVTREEHHQSVLARYPVAPGSQRQVAVELGRCVVGSGKHRGKPAIEVRLDGRRVGELTHLMSQRYGALVAQVTDAGGRPGCAATIQSGPRGLELVLRLPRDAERACVVPPPAGPVADMPPVPPREPYAATPMPAVPQQRRRGSARPAWIAAAVIAVALVAAIANDDESPSSTSAQVRATTTTAAQPTTTSRATTTQATTTTTPAPTTTTIAPAAPEPAVPLTTTPLTTTPKTTTRKAATTTKPATQAPPPPAAEPAPQSKCDPNYSGCVPVASDVDCAGGTGNGPAYVAGPVRVIGRDIYGLDHNKDGVGCE